MSYPNRWTTSHFKKPPPAPAPPKVRTSTKARAKKTRKARTRERSEKQKARDRDRSCRFPSCGCRAAGYALHVAHQQHKGMGGNPKGDRSTEDRLLLLCAPRHRESPIAVDKSTIRYETLTDKGTSGPIAWSILQGVLPAKLQDGTGAGYWITLARETSRHTFEPFTPRQRAILAWLKEQKP